MAAFDGYAYQIRAQSSPETSSIRTRHRDHCRRFARLDRFSSQKSNENRPFSNSEVCSGLLLLRGMILCRIFVVVVVVVVVLDVSRQFPTFSKRAICLKKNNHLVARRNDVRPSDATHRKRSHRVVPVLLRERRVLLRGDWRTRRLWDHVIAIGR